MWPGLWTRRLMRSSPFIERAVARMWERGLSLGERRLGAAQSLFEQRGDPR